MEDFPPCFRRLCAHAAFSALFHTAGQHFVLCVPPPRMVKYRAYRKNRTRPRRESFSLPGLIGEEPFLANELFGLFGSHLFDDRVMRERLPLSVYESLREIRDEGKPWNPEVADIVADAMQAWAMEQGATHYIHWFSPMTGTGSGKHDSFIDGVKQGEPILNFFRQNACQRRERRFQFSFRRAARHIRGARIHRVGPHLPAFVLGTTLYYSHGVLRLYRRSAGPENPRAAQHAGAQQTGSACLRALGDTETVSVQPTVGAEQEYFLVDKDLFDRRLDLKVCGHTLLGAKPPKGQELEDHYYGSINERVREFMRELDEELWRLGVPAKTEHNEVAPRPVRAGQRIRHSQYRLRPQPDHDGADAQGSFAPQFCMPAARKAFAGVNGSGKHNN